MQPSESTLQCAALAVVSAALYQSRMDEGVRKFEESVGICRQAGEQLDLEGILRHYASVLKSISSLGEAVLALQEEEDICRQLVDSEGLSACMEKQETIHRDIMGQ